MSNNVAIVPNSAKKMSRLGLSFSAAFALLFLACVLPGSDGIYFVWFVTFPFSLVCHAIGGWLQAAFGLGEQFRFVIEAALLCLVGLVEFFAIGYLMELGWRNS
jgi:hypothetical protein